MPFEPPEDFGPPAVPAATALRVAAWLLVLLAVGLLVIVSRRAPLFSQADHAAPAKMPEPPIVLSNTPELAVAPAIIAPPAPEPLAPAPTPEVANAPVPPSVVDVPVVVTPASLVFEVNADGTIKDHPAPTDEDLLQEIKKLQEKFDQLQETVNLVVTQMMSDVQDENEQLRSELRRVQARDQAGLLANASVPRPGNDVIAGLAEEAAAGLQPEDEIEEAPLPSAEFSFNVMKEWGREPEAVAALGGDAPTLKGVIGVVPRGSAREDVESLGRELREKYAEYDNINVEIFDDPVAAQTFVDSQEMDSGHRVLSVSKYSATGRDALTYYIDGTGTDLAVGAMLDNAQPDAPEEALEDAPAEPAPADAAPSPKPKGRRSSR